MNSQALASLLRTILGLIGSILVTNHLATAPDVAQASTDLMTIFPALMSLISIGGGIWAHWNMKKVPQHATAIDQTVSPDVAERFHMVGKIVGALLIAMIVFSGMRAEARPFCIDPLNQIPSGCIPRNASTPKSAPKTLMDLLSQPLQDLANFINNDFTKAQSLTTAIPNLQDGNGNACWSLLLEANGIFKDTGPNDQISGLATALEQARLLVIMANKVCQNNACTQVFSEAGNALNTIAPIPNLPNLNMLCSKVPSVAQVAIAPPNVAATPVSSETAPTK